MIENDSGSFPENRRPSFQRRLENSNQKKKKTKTKCIYIYTRIYHNIISFHIKYDPSAYIVV